MSGWISVSDRLPKYSDEVLVSDGEQVWVACRPYSSWVERITHWQPLPEPPCT